MMWNSTNSTTDRGGMTTWYITLVTSLTVVGVMTLSANIILLITLLRFKSKHLKRSTLLFLIYKSLGHTVQGLGVMTRPHVPNHHCVYFGWLTRVALGTVVGGMLLLSLDSFITITKPYRHKFIMTPRMAKLSILLFSLFFLMLHLIAALVPGPGPRDRGLCTQNDSQVEPWLLLSIFLIGKVLICVTMGLQGYNIWVLWKRSSIVQPASPIEFVSNAVEPVNNQPLNTSNKSKVTRLYRLQRLLTVWMISSFVCWTPSCIIIMLRAIMDIYLVEMPVLVSVQPFFTVLPLIDGVLQPCLAIALSQEIRSGAKKLFCFCIKADNNGNAGAGIGVNGIDNVGIVIDVASHM